MLKFIQVILICVALSTMILMPASALAVEDISTNDVTPDSIAVDLVCGRPLGLVATVLGATVFAVSLPFSLLGGNAGQSARILVVEPAKFTFVRPLGDF